MSASKQDMTFPDLPPLHLWNMSARTAGHPGFHMPGHAAARFFTNNYAQALISIDTTELSSSDDLHDPSGPALLAMRESSRLYGSGETLFVTTGSTTGIQVMTASIITPATFLLIPRTVHMSVLHVLALLDCEYAFIPYPEKADRSQASNSRNPYLYPQLSAQGLEDALNLFPQATDILLVSPDYYGQCADLPALAVIARSHRCRLLVDEAHGSHFSFAKDLFPPDAMSSGADMCVQSLHKTLPALTMASQIHISADAIRSGKVSSLHVWDMLRLFETSSPSFVIAASSEFALAWMEKHGSLALAERIRDIQTFTARIAPLLGEQNTEIVRPGRTDPLHLVLSCDPDLVSAPELMEALEKRGIYIEFADLLRLVLIISPWQSSQDFDALFDAVSDSVCHMHTQRSAARAAGIRDGRTYRHPLPGDAAALDALWGTVLTGVPQRGISLRSAVFGGYEKETMNLAQAVDRICASAIAPYPPGIAVLWPGERISKVHIEVLQRLDELKIAVRGVHSGEIDVLLE